ncbi:MAG: hypothetical protein EAZ97_08420 [Bacteroidetes bacterium]|nr:MAG: hypothetical protein EAZ97_08420 [Bacteroidota bacterium]
MKKILFFAFFLVAFAPLVSYAQLGNIAKNLITAEANKLITKKATDFTNSLSKELTLDKDQNSKVQQASMDQFTQLHNLEAKKLPAAEQKTQAQGIFAKYDAQIKTILTVAQFTKYGPYVQTLRTALGY